MNLKNGLVHTLISVMLGSQLVSAQLRETSYLDMIRHCYDRMDSLVSHSESSKRLEIDYTIITYFRSEGEIRQNKEAVKVSLSSHGYQLISDKVEVYQDTMLKVILYPESEELLVQDIRGAISYNMFSPDQLNEILDQCTVESATDLATGKRILLSLPETLAGHYGIQHYEFVIDQLHIQNMTVHYAEGGEILKLAYITNRMQVFDEPFEPASWVYEKFWNHKDQLKKDYAGYTLNYVNR